MNTVKNIILTGAVIMLSLTSCSWSLDLDPSTKFDANTVFSSESSVDHYLYGLYAYLKNNVESYNSNAATYTDAYADLLKSGSWNQYGQGYNQVNQQESSFDSNSAGCFECWTGCYTEIRRVNEFIRDLSQTYADRFSASFISTRCAEARFVRDFAYWQLLRVYGRCILRTKVEGPEGNDKPLSSPAECWQFLIDDLKLSAADIPVSAIETGRLDKKAVFGFLSRIALYAEQWQEAVNAADSCKKYGGALLDNYASVFAESNAHNNENLITIDFTKDGVVSHRADVFFRPSGDSKYHGDISVYGELCPTAEMADEYENADSTPFDWDTQNTDPYTGREPRFYASILYNDAPWEGRRIQVYKVDADGNPGEDARQDYRQTSGTTSTPTGYYFRKFITENDTNWETKGSSHFGIHLRYAEVLLNKAEALANLNDLPAAAAPLNEVRARVGLLPRATTDKDEFMKWIRHERMVELAGEGLRYWDLRRWRLAETVLGGALMHGVDVTVNTDGSFTYKRIEVDAGVPRIFHERYYAFAIPLSERTNNNAIDINDNNPEW